MLADGGAFCTIVTMRMKNEQLTRKSKIEAINYSLSHTLGFLTCRLGRFSDMDKTTKPCGAADNISGQILDMTAIAV